MDDPRRLATDIQRQAAGPATSVSLLASAGSGKTKVLVDRFLRLCIEEGPGRANPRSILAVTFTRKAAVEIQERLLGQARRLALAAEDDLRRWLGELLGRRPEAVSASELQAAGALYEKILEDVSGLSVGTIHSFCQAILGRFAAEAGLDPGAALMENTDDLLDEAMDQLEREIAADPGLAAAAGEAGKDPGSVRAALRGMVGQRLRLDRWARSLQARQDPDDPLPPLRRQELVGAMTDQVLGELLAGLDLPAGDRLGELLAAMETELERVLNRGLDTARRAVDAEMSAQQVAGLDKAVNKLRQSMEDLRDLWRATDTAGRAALVPGLKEIFLTKEDKLRSFSRGKVFGAQFNNLFMLEALPLLDLIRSFGYFELMRTNGHLLRLAVRLLDICDDLKRRDQVIDFQDLEDFAVRLMSDQDRAMGLLFRLEDSIQHILLDEFQDTNYNQWDILLPFVDEFLAGGSDPGQRPTVFFVGDVKQSIYGFRGAEPELFASAQDRIRGRGENLTLPTNFRSLRRIVQAVGCLFTAAPLNEALPQVENSGVVQHFVRDRDDGMVTILDPFAEPEAEQAPGQDAGRGPEDEADESPGADQLAAAAAVRLARRLLADGTVTWDNQGRQRPLTWSDILVLCRSRTEIAVYEKAFRDAGIPVAAAGRGTLAVSREVQDVLALLRWLIYPEDDVALATVLRSPIFRLSEEQFQRALALRGLNRQDAEGKLLPPQRLWQAVRKLTGDADLGEAVTLLRSWRGRVGLESCHDLLRRIYREGGLPERYEAARGEQARENLLRLFDLALAPEVASTPTVRRLVEAIGRAARLAMEQEAVTPPDQARGRVRFMTIHGAKGLEAPVVFLVDADRPLGKQDPFVRLLPDDHDSPLLFKVDSKFRSGFTGVELPRSAVEWAAARAAARGRTEDANLLYVAMTRARDRLYVLGGEKCTGPDQDSFLRQLINWAEMADCEVVDRLSLDLLEPEAEAAAVAVPTGPWPVTPGNRWLPPALAPLVRTVLPSTVEDAGGPALPAGLAEPDESRSPASGAPDEEGSLADRQGAMDRGHLVHLLLELAADSGGVPAGDSPEHREARAIVEDPALAWIFRPRESGGRGLSEAPVIHRLGGGGPDAPQERVTGVIDRLIIKPGQVDIIDYKTNRTGGDPAAVGRLIGHYRPQLETYRRVMGALFPDREVRTWLLFTDPDFPAGSGRLQEVT
jgi:ATP-dependent helicase/nuclease subunit A